MEVIIFESMFVQSEKYQHTELCFGSHLPSKILSRNEARHASTLPIFSGYCCIFKLSSNKPRGDGIMDSALVCCTGSPGLNPAVSKAKQEPIQMGFLSA